MARTTIVHPELDRDRLLTYLEAFTTPRKHHDAISWGGGPDPAPPPLGQAFGALLEHLDPDQAPAPRRRCDHGHGHHRPRVAAQPSSAPATIVGGEPLSATAIRRLACNAQIIPVVLGGKGEILDLGRTRRLFSPAQRKAMRLRDQRCRAEGCTIPATWCEAHHLKPWSLGGSTDLDDGVLLCNWHHHRAHDRRFTADKLPSGDLRFHRRR